MKNKKKDMIDKNFFPLSSILMILLSVFLVAMFFVEINTFVTKKIGNNSNFYSVILKHNMCFLSGGSNNEEIQGDSSIKNNILNLLGINSKNAISIMGKELSYLQVENSQKEGTENLKDSVDKFSLDEDQVFKVENKVSKIDSKDKYSIYNPKLKKEMSKTPEVLIYHTHTCESYKPNGIGSRDKTQNVCAVGEEVKKELESKYGIRVLHDTTVHDAIAYDKSYERSSVTLKKYLKQYGDFKLIIDLHRDSVENKNAVTYTINNEKIAKFAFVMTRKNPHFSENMKIVNGMVDIANKLYPGFYKGIFCYNYGRKFYNQDLSKHAVLMEVGSHINTIEEAKASGKYLARLIAEYLNGK